MDWHPMQIVGIVVLAILFFLADQFGLDYFLLWLAKGDKPWSPYRMLPKGGQINYYAKGDPDGDFATFLYGHIPEWYYHKKDHLFYWKKDREFRKKFPNGPPLSRTNWEKRLHRLGIGWVGFWRRRYEREREWQTWDSVKGIHTKKMEKGKNAHIFFFSTTMALPFDKIPTKSEGETGVGIRVDGTVVFDALNVNPEKSEFLTGKWETQVLGAIRSRIREHVTNKTATELQTEKDTSGTNELVDKMLLANKPPASETGTVGLIEGHGIRIKSPRFDDFDLVEEKGDEEIANSMRKQTVARNDLETARTRAEEAKVRGRGRADELSEEARGRRAVVEAYGSHKVGPIVALKDAAVDGGLKVIGGDILASVNTD